MQKNVSSADVDLIETSTQYFVNRSLILINVNSCCELMVWNLQCKVYISATVIIYKKNDAENFRALLKDGDYCLAFLLNIK